MEKLRLEREKNKNSLNKDKEKFIKEILKTNKNKLITIKTKTDYSLWERIKKTLGVS